MKQLTVLPILLVVFFFAHANSVFATDGKYEQAMKKNIDAVYKAQTLEELQASVNSFQRIAEAEKSKWEPNYYAAFGNIMMATREKDGAKKDTYLDLAMESIKKAKELAPDESEIVALEGFVHMIRVTVDPATRGQQFAGLAMQTFGKAISLNPENPRALSLLAQMQYGTAQFFGSSTAEACATLDKSLEKFASAKSENPLAPMWGKQSAEALKTQCK
jgi:tetratricopeptide (TPR) repeat protein